MIVVHVRYLGKIADIAGKKEETLRLSGTSLKDLIGLLVETYGERMKNILLDADGKLSENIIILVNHRPIGGNINTKLNNSSRISILPFVSGG